MKKGQYFEATTKTVGCDTSRLITALSVSTGRKIKGGDVQTAYLLADQIRPCYVWPASHMDYLFGDDDVLSNLRRKLKQKVIEQGPQYIKKLNRKNKFKQHKVLRLLRAVYGTPDAGFAFQLLKDFAFEQAGAKRLFTDSSYRNYSIAH